MNSPGVPSREPYVAPRLTSYGRFQNITAASPAPPNFQADSDEAVLDAGGSEF